jgi:putative two-component system response regulator
MTETVASSGSVLVVEDAAANLELLVHLLKTQGYTVRSAINGEEALESIERYPPDLILLDVQLPGVDGFEVCRRVKQNPATRLIPVVLVTALQAREDRIEGIDAGADDFLSKPFDPQELNARIRSLLRLKRYTDELDSAESIILSLALTVEARDTYTDGHCQRLAAYASALGAELGLTGEDLAALGRGGYLHDVGKIGVPDELLLKPSKLTEGEYTVMKRHAVIGEKLCGQLRSLGLVRPIVRHHHERLDGSGYPDGLRDEAVPLLAQIVGIVDAYDAMTTDRPYRAAGTAEQAFEELTRDATRGLHRPDLVGKFIALGRKGHLATLAKTLPPGLREHGSVQTVDASRAIETIAWRVAHEGSARVAALSSAIDWEDLHHRACGDEVLIGDLIAIFLDDCPAQLEAIKAAIAARDGERIRKTAHALKGVAANLAARDLVAAAHTLEILGAGAALTQVSAAWSQLEDEADRVLTGLAARRRES